MIVDNEALARAIEQIVDVARALRVISQAAEIAAIKLESVELELAVLVDVKRRPPS
jgi:hypothetical protein